MFDNKNPTDFDPILKVRNITFDIEPGKVSFNWNDIRQANEYVLYENDVEIYRGKENRFEIDIYPGSVIFVPRKIDNSATRRLATQAYVSILGNLGVALASLSAIDNN